ncbi:MAG: hypothetical protein ACYTG2_01625, partial [Planctomycetota bacterium]
MQVLLFTAFVYALFEPVPRGAEGPRMRDCERPDAFGPGRGLLASIVGCLKVSQVHAWLLVARVRPRAAILGALPLVALAALSFPAVGQELYREWLGQAE